MKGSEFINTLPPGVGQVTPEGLERDLMILDFIKNNGAIVDWYPLVVERGNASATFLVTNALQVGEPDDAVRVSMSQLGQQQLADRLNAVLFTKMLADEHYRQAPVKIAPPARDPTSSTQAMLDQSRKIDSMVAKKTSDPTATLIGNEGKFWLNHTKLFGPGNKPTLNKHSNQPNAVNYGWYGKPGSLYKYPSTIPGTNTIQPAATEHDFYHVDYSQLVYLVARPVLYCFPKAVSLTFMDEGYGGGDVGDNYTGMPCQLPDGTEGEVLDVDIYNALNDPELRQFFTKGDETLPYMRHPAVEWSAGSSQENFDPKWPIDPGQVPPPDVPPPVTPPTEVAGVSAPVKAAAVGVGGILGYMGCRKLIDYLGRR